MKISVVTVSRNNGGVIGDALRYVRRVDNRIHDMRFASTPGAERSGGIIPPVADLMPRGIASQSARGA